MCLTIKAEYFTHYLLDKTQTLEKTSGAKIMIKNLDNGFRVFRGKLKENSLKISSLAVLSPSC